MVTTSNDQPSTSASTRAAICAAVISRHDLNSRARVAPVARHLTCEPPTSTTRMRGWRGEPAVFRPLCRPLLRTTDLSHAGALAPGLGMTITLGNLQRPLRLCRGNRLCYVGRLPNPA